MKKIILIIVAIFLLLTFAACGTQGAQQNTQEAEPIYLETEPDKSEAEEFYIFPFALEPIIPTELHYANIPEEDIIEHAVHGDWSVFNSLNDKLTDIATTEVVRARILSERVELQRFAWPSKETEEILLAEGISLYDIAYDIFTIYQIQILDVFLSYAELVPGDVIEVRERGGQIGNERLIAWGGIAPLIPGDDLLLFLYTVEGDVRRNPDRPLLEPELFADESYFARPAGFINPWQGAYYFPAADNRMHSLNADDELSQVQVGFNLYTPTIDDLIGLQIRNFGYLSESFEALLTEEAAKR